MKKVLVLVAVFSLLASSAFALIAGGKHDMSVGTADNESTETCVYCHTPHGAGTIAPLWNRTAWTGATGFYNSATLNAATSLDGVNTSDAALCLSCHDGTTLANAVSNPPNFSGALGTTMVGLDNNSTMGTDLSDDHPIGFTYDAALVTADGELKAVGDVITTLGSNVFYGTGADQMWCSSCHDVHKYDTGAFLRISNNASALCLACHIK